MGEANLNFGAESKREAIKRYKGWAAKWVVEEERVLRCMGKDLFACLYCYDFDKVLWRAIRSTNVLGGAFRPSSDGNCRKK